MVRSRFRFLPPRRVCQHRAGPTELKVTYAFPRLFRFRSSPYIPGALRFRRKPGFLSSTSTTSSRLHPSYAIWS
jgi:hypothetical protein